MDVTCLISPWAKSYLLIVWLLQAQANHIFGQLLGGKKKLTIYDRSFFGKSLLVINYTGSQFATVCETESTSYCMIMYISYT